MKDDATFTVSELTRQIKNLVEANFPTIHVVGEISNCTKASSGHIYLTLKDDNAQIRAVMWRSTASRLKFDVEDGLEVVAKGPVEVYQARGSYQLIIERLVPQGVGALELAFQQLQQKLHAEGLFDPEHKRALPPLPRRIALITSPTSAAVRDMLQVLTRRWPAVQVVVVPVAVQGQAAAGEIAAALNTVHKIPDVDVVIAGRGGGSLEDLWSFNEEIVARAIFNCKIPVISAVGHEIDVTIADLVADRRALTPSEAAELAVPDVAEVRNGLRGIALRLQTVLRDRAQRNRAALDSLASRRLFTHPLGQIHEQTNRVDDYQRKLHRLMTHSTQSAQQKLRNISSSLAALSPLGVLKRGYTLSQDASNQTLSSIQNLKPGDQITTLFADGTATSAVESIDTTSPIPAIDDDNIDS